MTEEAAFLIYEAAWRAAVPFLSKNRRLSEGIEQRKLHHPLPEADIWIQAASVGEAFLARCLINRLSFSDPVRVLLTTNTRQGMDILAAAESDPDFKANHISLSRAYFPFDRPSLMKKAVRSVRPRVMVLLESELWPGHLKALKEAGSKVVVVNGRINPKSLSRYMAWPNPWRSLAPDRILAISRQDADRFSRLFGPERVGIMSNIKFDRIGPASYTEKVRENIRKIVSDDTPFLVLASVRRQEEEPVEKMIARILKKNPKVVIGLFPRHMHRVGHWNEKLGSLCNSWVLRSRTTAPVQTGSVILWDTFGELTASYSLARAAFVGGSLADLGGQNFLEPVTCGVVPVTGPSWYNFYWVGKEIFDQGLAKKAGDWETAVGMLLSDIRRPAPRKDVAKKALGFIHKRQGGTRQACREIEKYLNST